MNFLSELKRRNVFRIAGLYLVGAWLITQVAGTVLPMFGAPDWVPRTIVIVLAIGFIPALAFAWVFEFTPDGIKRDEDVAPGQSIAPQTAQRMNRLILALLLVALTYFGFDKFVLAPKRELALVASTAQAVKADALAEKAGSDGRASIAVLPFVNMSTDADNGFFADGISEELLNVLAGVKGLKVASRTSAFSFKGKSESIPEIARQLGVDNVLEGSVRKQGKRVRITAQLIQAGTDVHLWSGTYDRDLDDIFKVQEEIAQAITTELQGILGKQQIAVVASTRDLDAYQSFLSGRARFNQREGLLTAIDELSSAVQRDPKFAEAWIYLAATWRTLPGYSGPEIDLAKSGAASKAALAHAAVLAPNHPMVLALKAQQLDDSGDLVGALELLGRAAQSSTQDSNPMLWYGSELLRCGYVKEALARLERAQAMDPLAGVNNGYLAIAYLSDGQYQKAETVARKASEQSWPIAMDLVIYDLAARGERDRALALWDEFVSAKIPAPFAKAGAARRELLRDPHQAAALALLLKEGDLIGSEFSLAIGRYDQLFAGAEQEQEKEPAERASQWWLRSAWLPSSRGLRESPRFWAIADGLGMTRLWEARGYPPGCRRAGEAGSLHLDCAGMVR